MMCRIVRHSNPDAGMNEAYEEAMLLARHEAQPLDTVRVWRNREELGTIAWTAGLKGPIPTVNYARSFFRGRILYKKEYAKGYALKQLAPPEPRKVYDYKFDVNEIRGPIVLMVEDGGWEWVPVTARRHATYKARRK